MSRKLTHSEFAAQGGGSRRFADATEGPTSGFYVSRHPSEGGETKVSGTATATDIASHWATNKRRVLESGKNPREVYQGLWKSDGTSYLDVSDRVGTQTAAISKGLKNNQKAAYNANVGVSLHLNPQGASSPDRSAASIDPRSTKAHYKAATQNGKLTWLD